MNGSQVPQLADAVDALARIARAAEAARTLLAGVGSEADLLADAARFAALTIQVAEMGDASAVYLAWLPRLVLLVQPTTKVN